MSVAFDRGYLPATDRPPVVIVGAGPVGVRLAGELGRRTEELPIVIYSDEPWEPYNRVRLSSFLAGELGRQALGGDRSLPEDGRVLRIHRRVVEIDRAERCVRDAAGFRQSYSSLVLATGSLPRVPGIPGIELAGVYTFRHLGDADRLLARQIGSRRTVVLGGGPLGLEAARAMQRFHAEVVLVHSGMHLMNRQLDAAAAALLRGQVEALGIEVVLGDSVTEVLGESRVGGVRLRSGRLIDCDTVIAATGIVPNVELARQAGLGVGCGVRVDDAMRTSDPDIYAVGECVEHRGRLYGIVAPGLEQAAVAAAVIGGGEARYRGSVPATRLKVVGCPVFSMGRVGDEESLTTARRPFFSDTEAGVYRRLVVHDWRLSGVIAVGEWSDLGRLQEAVIRNRRVWPWQLWRFRRTGSLWPATAAGGVASWAAATTVCNCTGVSRGRLGELMAEGCTSVETLAARSGASTVCGSCRPLLAELVGGSIVPEPVRAYRPLMACAAAALLVSLLLLLAPGISYPHTAQMSFDVLWRDDVWRQCSGFTVLGLTALGVLLSVRKRWLRCGDFALWRLFHVLTGMGALVALAIHTGGRPGDQLNLLLVLCFLLLIVAGAGAGGLIAGGYRWATATAARLRRQAVWLHILIAWPVPVLLGFHVLKFYYF